MKRIVKIVVPFLIAAMIAIGAYFLICPWTEKRNRRIGIDEIKPGVYLVNVYRAYVDSKQSSLLDIEDGVCLTIPQELGTKNYVYFYDANKILTAVVAADDNLKCLDGIDSLSSDKTYCFAGKEKS